MDNTSTVLKSESHVDASELLAEIVPLMRDLFVGCISFDGKNITYRMPSGQCYRISAETV